MKRLFFLYVWLNLTRIAELRKEDLVKHIRKRTIQTGRLFFSSSLTFKQHLLSLTQGTNNHGICQRTIYFLRINIIIYKTTLHMAIEIACTVLSVRGFNGVYFIQMEVIKFIIFK